MPDDKQNAASVSTASVTPEIPFWRAPWEFAVHGVVGTLIFAIIAALAVLLNISVQRLELLGISKIVIYGLDAAEYAIFATDLFLFLVFLAKTARRTMRDL